jgi:hypothetical protein
LPIRIVNLLSLDPPPTFNLYQQSQPLGPRLSQTFDADSEARGRTPVSGSYHYSEREDDFSDAGSDTKDEGFQESSYTEEDPQLEAQLGNLSMCDDAEDLVHHAIVSAQMDDGSQQLEDPSQQLTKGLSEEPAEERAEQEPEIYEPRSCSELHPSSHDHISRSSRLRGPSSFAQRVQKKLEVVSTARQSLVPVYKNETSALELDANQDAATTLENLINAHLNVPSGSAISSVSGYRAASSSFLDTRYSGSIPQSNRAGESSGSGAARGSRVLPKPPSIVGLPFHELAPNFSESVPVTALGIATFAVADKRAADLDAYALDMANCSLEQLKQQLKPRRPSIAPGASAGSAGSVKDKIRELEERARAAEGY